MWYYDYVYGETEDEGIVNIFVFMLRTHVLNGVRILKVHVSV
jgi:hypothetical protein